MAQCEVCAYERIEHAGLKSPPFFGPKPNNLEPCAGCWEWHKKNNVRLKAATPRHTTSDLLDARRAGYEAAREQARRIVSAQPVSHVDGEQIEHARRITLNYAAHEIANMVPDGETTT